ncbi:MAG: histidine phosphatase family protein [Elusimicrobia bacterium]|nr:histidine phosphatase family protein [Elusimicrobiota bacterium]
MNELVFLRHGAALSIPDSKARNDAGRRLAPEGRAQAGLSASRLEAAGFSPSLIISSPYSRAVETADIAAGHFPAAKRASVEALASPSSLGGILKAIEAAAGGERSVLVVGHQPTLGALSARLLKTAVCPLSAGGYAYLKLPGGLTEGGAELVDFFSPETPA